MHNQTRRPPPQSQAPDDQHHQVIRTGNGIGYDEVPAQTNQSSLTVNSTRDETETIHQEKKNSNQAQAFQA